MARVDGKRPPNSWTSGTGLSLSDDNDRHCESHLTNLSQYDHEGVHRRLSHKRVANTTQWFIDHPDFQNRLLERSVRSL
jgi:hypothetical protein